MDVRRIGVIAAAVGIAGGLAGAEPVRRGVVDAGGVLAADGVLATDDVLAPGHGWVHGCWGDEHGHLDGGRFFVPLGGATAEDLPADVREQLGRGFGSVDNNRLDLVLVGDGYTEADMAQYQVDAQTVAAEFFRDEPFITYKPYFQVTIVEVESNESGVDNDPSNGVEKDTALNMGYWCNGIARLLCVDTGLARSHALLGAEDVDQILAIANSATYGGAGYSSADMGTLAGQNAAAVEIAIHEMGHSLGVLGDEYLSGGPTVYEGGESTRANLSIYDQSEQIALETKWHEWMEENIQGFDGWVRTFEGGGYSQLGIYRPSNNSIMRSLNRPFNLPSAEKLIWELYEEISPIDEAPADGAAFAWSDSVTVVPMRPDGHDLEIEWLIDGEVVASGAETLELASLGLGAGEFELTLRVVDPTPWVRNEAYRAGRLTDTRVYTVTGCAGTDFNGDGVLDLADVAAFTAAFVAEDPAADLAEPAGVWDLGDVTAFVDGFVTGCL